MRKLAILVAALCALVSADPATLLGQQVLASGQIKFGRTNYSKTLYILNAKYMVDSTNGTRVNLDTSFNAVSTSGASSWSTPLQTVTAISQQSACELSYQIRATDVNDAGILFTAFGQYRTPWTDTDTSWSAASYLWNADTAQLYHAPPAPTTGFTTRRWNFYPAGDNIRINVQRTDVGSGDTVVIKGLGLRCR